MSKSTGKLTVKAAGQVIVVGSGKLSTSSKIEHDKESK